MGAIEFQFGFMGAWKRGENEMKKIIVLLAAGLLFAQDCWKDCPGGWQVPCNEACPTENVPPGACPGDKGCPGNQQQ